MSDRTKWRRWALLTIALFPLLAIWAAANPMFASPDETVHMVRAQGFANLDFSDPYRTDGIPITEVNCFRFRPDATADCMVLAWPAGPIEIGAPSINGYPPLLHLIAAVPAVAIEGLGGAYVMRWWMAFVVAAGFGFAGMLLTRPTMGRWPLVALVAGMTPQVLFISSSVNPSGVAAAAGAMLAAGLVTLSTPYGRGREVRAAILVGAVALVLNRRDGVIMLAAVLVATAPFWAVGFQAAARAALMRLRTRNRSPIVLSLGVPLLVGAALVIGGWGTYALDFVGNPGRRRGTAGFTQALGTVPTHFAELIGIFGWLDTWIGPVFVAVGLVLVAVVMLLAVAAGSTRGAVAVVWSLAVLASLVIFSHMLQFGYLQARYLFPVWFAALIGAGVTLDCSELTARVSRRLSTIILVLWCGLQLGAFYTNQRRYSVGMSEVWNFSAESQWDPPVFSNTEVVLLFATALLTGGIVLRRLEHVRRQGRITPVASPVA